VELAAITTALDADKLHQTLSILTNSAFDINTIRKYNIDPLSFIHHPHKHLLHLVDNIIRTRNNMGYKKHIGKVKLHTGVTHNDEADTTARNVVEGHKTPDMIFTSAGRSPVAASDRESEELAKSEDTKGSPPTSLW